MANVVIPVILLTLMACVALESLLKQFEKGDDNSRPWIIGLYAAVILSIPALYFSDQSRLTSISGADPGSLLLLPAAFGLFALVATIILRNKTWLAALPVALLFVYLPQYSMWVHPKVPDSTQLYNQCDDFLALEQALGQWADRYPDNSRLAVHLPANGIEGCLGDRKVSNALLQSVAAMAGWNVMQGYLSPRPYLEFKLFSRLSSSKALRSHSQLLKAGISHVLTVYPSANLSGLNGIYRETERVGQFVLYEVTDWQLGQDIAGCITGRNRQFQIVTAGGRRAIELPPGLVKAGLSDLRCGESRKRPANMSTDISRQVDNGELRYSLETSRPLLFVSDRVMRDDWLVRLNGEVVEPVKIDQYRMAVVVGEGSQEIEFIHRPRDFRLGLVISSLGFLLLLSLALWQRFPGWSAKRGITP